MLPLFCHIFPLMMLLTPLLLTRHISRYFHAMMLFADYAADAFAGDMPPFRAAFAFLLLSRFRCRFSFRHC